MTAPPPDDTNYSDDPYSSDDEYKMVAKSGNQARLNRERPELSRLRIPGASQEVDNSRAASPSPVAEDHSPTVGPDAPMFARYAPGPDSPVLGPPGMNPRPAPAEQNPAQANTQSPDTSTGPAAREQPAPKDKYSLYPDPKLSDPRHLTDSLPQAALSNEARALLARTPRPQQNAAAPNPDSTSKMAKAWAKIKPKGHGRSK
jgi:hypothetical protein